MPLLGTFGAGSKGGYGRGGKKLYALSYLVIAGGGTGRGPDRGGGGGAGGYRTNFPGDPLAGDALEIEAGTYPVTVGGPATNSSLVYSPASDTISASAGSQGAGGSGGGGFSSSDPGRLGRAGNIGGYTPPEGNPGGDAQPFSGNPYAAGGGGGAASTGGAYNTGGTNGGPGGPGQSSSITGSSVTRAGGGGGGVYQSGSGGNGGSGGGGPANSTGSANTGGGGGGANMITHSPRQGGSGIVVVRFPADTPLSTSGGSPSTAPNGDQILTFTGSGTYTVG